MNTIAGSINRKLLFKVYAWNQAVGLVLGWFFHSVVSHIWTGDHEYNMNIPQFLMHNVSMVGCALIFLYFQDRAVNRLFGFRIIGKWWIYLLIPTVLFWVGFFLRAVPLDVLLWFLSVGWLNGIYISSKIKTHRWTMWSTLSGLVGFIVGALLLFPLDNYLTTLSGLTAHIVMFTLLGIAGGIPMALFGALMLGRNFREQG